MFLKFAPAIKSENPGNTFYDQFYCCTFTMFKNHLTLNFAFSLKKLMGILQFSVFTRRHQNSNYGIIDHCEYFVS